MTGLEMPTPAMPDDVRAVFAAFPPAARPGLHLLRQMILTEAATLPAIGPLTEALRWGQPAYLTLQTGAACSLRIGTAKGAAFALFVHCATDLIARFAHGPGHGLQVQGTRAVLFQGVAQVDDRLGFLIRGALTWHVRPPP